jgi:hypothetical protein
VAELEEILKVLPRTAVQSNKLTELDYVPNENQQNAPLFGFVDTLWMVQNY